ncbi:MAG: hypothetical protein R3A45_04165 [Bdellovibrionota bacterium]
MAAFPQKTSIFFIKRMGYYRNIQICRKNYINIVFRIVGGVLAGLPLESVAFFTTIERLIWLIFEVPGGWIADKWGRIKTTILGHIMMLLAYISAYIAYLSTHYHWQASLCCLLH